MSDSVKKIDSMVTGGSPFPVFDGNSEATNPISEVAAEQLNSIALTPEQHAYAEAYNESLGWKVYEFCERYFVTINPAVSKQISVIADKLDTAGGTEFQEELEYLLNIFLDNPNPGTFKQSYELLLTMLDEEQLDPKLIQEIRHDFLDLCHIYKDNRSDFQKFIARTEVFLFFVTKANRLARNLCRVVGALSDSLAMQGLVTVLGVGNLVNAALALKNMLEALVKAVRPGVSIAGRMGAIGSALISYFSFVEDLSIALYALKTYVESHEFLKNFSACGIYFAFAGVLLAIAKNIFDLIFYQIVINEIKGDEGVALDYSMMAERWKTKIRENGKIFAFLIKALDPQVLKDLHDLDTQAEKHGDILPGDRNSGSKNFTKEINSNVRSALLGRLTERKMNTKWALVSNIIDSIAVTLFISTPLTQGFAIASAGALMVKSTAIGLWRWKQNRDSEERYVKLLTEVFGGIHRKAEWSVDEEPQLDENVVIDTNLIDLL